MAGIMCFCPFARFIRTIAQKMRLIIKLLTLLGGGTFEAMQKLLRKGSENLGNKHQKYVISVTEEEVHRGILDNPNANNQCFFFRRDIDQIDTKHTDASFGKFVDAVKSGRDLESKILLEKLKQTVETKLEKSRQCFFNSPYPSVDPTYGEFVKEFCDSVCEKLANAILRAYKEKGIHNTPLISEVLYHHNFAKERSSSFVGKATLIKSICESIGFGKDNHPPIVVHGESGSGKTSVIAHIVANMPNIIQNNFQLKKKPEEEETKTKKKQGRKGKKKGNGKDLCAGTVTTATFTATVVYRFIGITPSSTSIPWLFSSICKHLHSCYQQDEPVFPENNLDKIIQEFHKCLTTLPTDNRPLMLVIDSLDQLIGEPNELLPLSLSKNVAIIVSTIPCKWLDFFNGKLASHPEALHKVNALTIEEGEEILDTLLCKEKRTLTIVQRDLVLNKFKGCPSPLFLVLCIRFAVGWTSFSEPTQEFKDAKDTHELIELIFRQIEGIYGKVFTSLALSLVTAAKEGISTVELEDIISCDEEALISVYEWWEPPIRRCPSLLWKRMLFDLREYIAEKGSNGIPTLGWYHRQFLEVAAKRYMSTPERKLAVHTKLADYFEGKWYNTAVPYFDKSSQTQKASVRFVAGQPFIYEGGLVNYRKLAELPYHLQQLGDVERMLRTLVDFDFIEASFIEHQHFDLLEYYSKTAEKCTGEMLGKLNEYRNCIQKNQLYLVDTPDRIIQQAANAEGSLYISHNAQNCMQQSYRWAQVVNKSTAKDLLTFTFAKGATDVYGFDIHRDTIAIVNATKVYLWSISTGKCTLTIEHSCGEKEALSIGSVRFSHSGRYVATSFRTTIRIWEAKTGTLWKTLSKHEEGKYIVGVIYIGWSKDDTRLVSASRNQEICPRGTVLFWNLETNQSTEIEAYTYENGVLANSRGHYTYGADACAESGRLHQINNNGCVDSGLDGIVALSANSRYACINIKGKLRVTDMQTKEPLGTLKALTNMYKNVGCVSDNGQHVSFPIGNVVHVLSRKSGEYVLTAKLRHATNLNRPPHIAAFSEDSNYIFTLASSDNCVRMWDISVGNISEEVPDDPSIKFCALTFDPTIHTLRGSFAQPNGLLRIVNALTRETILHTYTTKYRKESLESISNHYVKEFGGYHGFKEKALTCISANVSHTLIGYDDGSFSLYGHKNKVFTLIKVDDDSGLTGAHFASPFASDLKYITTHENGTVRIWEGVKTKDSYKHDEWVSCSAISGGTVASFAADLSIFVRSPQGRILKFRTGSDLKHGWVNCLSFSRDSELLAGGCDDGSIRIWNLSKSSEDTISYKKINCHKRKIVTIAFYGTNHVVTIGLDRLVRLTHIASGEGVIKYPLWNLQWDLFGLLVCNEPEKEDTETVFVSCVDMTGKSTFLKLHGLPNLTSIREKINFQERNNNFGEKLDVFDGVYDGEYRFFLEEDMCWVDHAATVENVKPGYYSVTRDLQDDPSWQNDKISSLALIAFGHDDSIRGTHTIWENTRGAMYLGVMKVLLSSNVKLQIRMVNVFWKAYGINSTYTKIKRVSPLLAQQLIKNHAKVVREKEKAIVEVIKRMK
eukprot:Phypoly_transcript_00198.p1 GENE.Phypoly_transcript_00198~~Phypoly_transcript_00198.p1  ORF type:complete len:1578 (+),score=179.43 Phypoly_transcript_00198:1034-5767(+)